MDSKALTSAIITFVIALTGGAVFLFFSSGFLPENCIVMVGDNGCAGLASIFPRGLQGLLFIILFGWCVYIVFNSYKEEVKENTIKRKNAKITEEYRN